MLIAHVAPSDGPLRILITSEFVTAPLFAMLVGAGAELGRRRTASGAFPGAQTLIRAACVFLVGIALAQSQAQIWIILPHLAVIMVLCFPLARLRSPALIAVTVLLGAVALALPIAVASGALAQHPDLLQAALLLGGAGPYRLAASAFCAGTAMLLVRILTGRERALPAAAASALAFAAMGALLILPNLVGLFPVHADDGTPAELLGSLCGAAGILLACWALSLVPAVRTLPQALRDLVCAPGRMTLTLYSLQVLILDRFARAMGGARDDHWWMLALLILALGAFAAVWWLALGRPGSAGRRTIWWRGPLEGMIGGLERMAAPRARLQAEA